MLSIFRSVSKSISKALAFPFIALKIHPNLVSLLGIPLAILAAYFLSVQDFFLALIFLILTPIMDMIDGTVARELNLTSNWGNYFETMVDKVVEVIIFFGFATLFPFAAILALGFRLLESYAKPRVALVIIADNRDWPAIGEHADVFFLLILGVFASIFSPMIYGIHVAEFILYGVAIISLIGLIQRMMYAKKLILEAEKNQTLLPYIQKGTGGHEKFDLKR